MGDGFENAEQSIPHDKRNDAVQQFVEAYAETLPLTHLSDDITENDVEKVLVRNFQGALASGKAVPANISLSAKLAANVMRPHKALGALVSGAITKADKTNRGCRRVTTGSVEEDALEELIFYLGKHNPSLYKFVGVSPDAVPRLRLTRYPRLLDGAGPGGYFIVGTVTPRLVLFSEVLPEFYSPARQQKLKNC